MLGGGSEIFGFVGIPEGSIMGLLRSLTSFFGVTPGRAGVVEIDFALSDARFEVVELSVEDAGLTEVATLEGPEPGGELGFP